MQTWRDTVMDKAQVNKILAEKGSSIPDWLDYTSDHPDYKMCLAQAEISFKAGQKSVVEWIGKENTNDGYGYGFEPLDKNDILIVGDRFEAKLKEWDIKEHDVQRETNNPK